MFIAPSDRALDDEEWRSFVTDQGFGHLVAAGRGRDVPEVTATQFVLDGDQVLLHVVTRNPVLDAIAEQPAVLVCVAGDWAFIPSSWKALDGEDPALGIPTTYYGAVELVGTATVIDDPDRLAALLRRQLSAIQPGVPVADPGDVHRPKLAGIRGIAIAVTGVRAKFKYGGNVDGPHRLRVAERLEERQGPGDAAAAAHLRRRDGRMVR
jgi:transcriptional regulator